MRRLALLLALLPLISRADERSVIPGGAGPNRLDPDVIVLSRAQPLRYSDPKTFTGGLDDLRLKDGSGAEVPYVLIPRLIAPDSWAAARVLPVAPTKTTSGFEADLGAVRIVDRIRIEGISAPFMKRLTLEGSGDRVHYTMLAADATLFDLPEDKLRNLDVDFAAGEYRYLRVTWNDRASAVVRAVGTVRARMQRGMEPAQTVRGDVAFRRISSEPGRSRYRLQLAGPHLPVTAIELVVTNQNVLREAEIAESRLRGSEVVPVQLGAATLRKASHEGASAANLSVPIQFPEGADLDLLIADGNNSPLSIERIDARFAPLPWIYFESSDGKPLQATCGNAALNAPRYDLEAMRKSIHGVKVGAAKWGPAAAKPTATTPEGAIVLRGAPAKQEDFRYRRAIPAGIGGPARLILDAGVLAHSRDVADVRIVDASNSQVPYLVERQSEPLIVNLDLPACVQRDHKSVYTLTLPYDSLPPHSKLIVATSARVFSRTAELQRLSDDSPRDRFLRTLATATWSNADTENDPPALTFDADLAGAHSVELVLDEGDNAPLPLVSAKLLIPAVALRFYHPGGPLKLLYGNPTARAPRYDLELLASRVFSESARDIALPGEQRAQPEQAGTSTRFFWAAIVLAVVALFIVLARLIGGRVGEES